MKYVVAVSGGVDSVVLLDMLVKTGTHELIVAHFDHGIRPDSADDARFVAGLAERYGLPFEVRREELGASASEEQARERRYEYLRAVAAKHGARIVTAHHQDDAIETIVINLLRGTGWRGLAVLGDNTLVRPLLGYAKRDFYAYSLEHGLEWVQDHTNLTDAYLRNRVRQRLAKLPEETKKRVVELWRDQAALAAAIDEQANELKTGSRYFMTMIDDTSALELLRAVLGDSSRALTRPQRARLLHAIKTARPGSTFEAGPQTAIGFTVRDFIVKHP